MGTMGDMGLKKHSKRPEMEDAIVSMTTSAMFGEKGPEDLRIGPNRPPRTLGLGWLLYAFTRVVQPETILEVGAGGSSFCMLHGLRHNKKGHLHIICYWPEHLASCVDHLPKQWHLFHPDGTPFRMEHANFLKGLHEEEFEDICTLNVGKSVDLGPRWSYPIDMLVVDSSHLLVDTIAEWDLTKWIKPGGYAFFHDFTVCAHDVGAYIEQMVDNNDEWTMIVEPDFLSMAIIQRKYTYSSDKAFFMSSMYDPATNPQAFSTPVQSTNARESGWFENWKGYWIPSPEEWNKNGEVLKAAGLSFRESGQEQSIENINKAIKEAKNGI